MRPDASWFVTYGIGGIALAVAGTVVWAYARSLRALGWTPVQRKTHTWIFGGGVALWMLVTGWMASSGRLANFEATPPPFLVVFIGVMAVGFGVGLSILLFLYKTSRPHIAEVGLVPGTEHFRNVRRHEVRVHPEVMTLRLDENLYFANARYIEDFVLDKLETFGQEILEAQTAGLHIEDFLAAQTGEMMMVLGSGKLVENQTPGHVDIDDSAFVGKCFQIAIDRGDPDTATGLLGDVVNLLD